MLSRKARFYWLDWVFLWSGNLALQSETSEGGNFVHVSWYQETAPWWPGDFTLVRAADVQKKAERLAHSGAFFVLPSATQYQIRDAEVLQRFSLRNRSVTALDACLQCVHHCLWYWLWGSIYRWHGIHFTTNILFLRKSDTLFHE